MLPYHQLKNGELKCLLCPHNCILANGKTGICGVRKNTGDKIELLTYGILSGQSLDPVEKKPLYHFYPGYNILSIGSFGCNMKCDFCQNFHISQKAPERHMQGIAIDKIVSDALRAGNNIGIAFTYNEPVIWFEYMRDVAQLAKRNGLTTVMVSNGYVNPLPMAYIIEFIDAFNIDLKAFNNNFYRKVSGAEIGPVKSSLKQIVLAGRHLEITTLIIPGLNDNEEEMKSQSEWIANELGDEVPFHLSKYFPNYRRETKATGEISLKRLFDIASTRLKYVYIGNTNLPVGNNTSCPDCGTIVTIRSGYNAQSLNLYPTGKCLNCGKLIYKNFNFS